MNKTYEIINELWCKLFNRDTFSDDDTFTSLKGYGKKADELFSLLEETFGKGLHISPTVAYDYPTIAKQVAYIDELIAFASPRTTKQEIRAKNQRTLLHEPIAIIGMSCRLPGGINTEEEYWQALTEGKNLLEEIPANRWDVESYYDPDPRALGKMAIRQGGFISDHDKFDAAFFHIAPKEAEYIDPNQRITLETAWHALEDAGIEPRSLNESATGVFIGSMFHDYEVLLERANLAGENLKYLDIGISQAASAGRISYTLGLQGPSMTIDTACSSSLTAIHEACLHLFNDECDIALAGGVNLMLLPEVTISFSQAHMLSPDGQCRSFSDNANGYVRSEGCGIIVLKRLKDALAAGDRIRAVIKGTAVNQDGASGGFTVPSRLAQQAILEGALTVSEITPHDIDYIEAHGTGTPLGDPIEMGAIENVYKGRNKTLYIGSVKSNMGHLEAASGVTGLMKVILALHHEMIPPNIHFRAINPRINLETIPAQIVTQNTPWQKSKNHVRRAGVSNFGFTGTNVHLIVEESPELSYTPRAPLPLTAFNRQRYWAPVLTHKRNNGNGGQELHPLLGFCLPATAKQTATIFEQVIDLDEDSCAYLQDHCVFNFILFPAAGYIELALAALSQHHVAQQACVLEQLSIERPLALSSALATTLEVVLTDKNIEIFSKQDTVWQLQAQAQGYITPVSYHAESLEQLQKQLNNEISAQSFYELLKSQGLDYGTSFQAIQSLQYRDNEALISLKSTKWIDHRYHAHPALIDGALQAMVWLVKPEENGIYLPVSVDTIKLHQPLGESCIAHIKITEKTHKLLVANITWYNQSGQLLLSMEGFKAKRATRAAVTKLITGNSKCNAWYQVPIWQPYKITFDENIENHTSTHCVFDARGNNKDATNLQNALDLLAYIQKLISENQQIDRLIVITEQAYSLNNELIYLNQSCLNGFIKTAILEHPELNIRQLDVIEGQVIEPLLALLNKDKSSEQIIAYRDEQWFTEKVVKQAQADKVEKQLSIPAGEYKLIKNNSGVVEELKLAEGEELTPEANEVILEPKAVGLNFRDVLNAMNLYPGDPGPLGSDCAGIIKAIGKDVKGYAIGDEVLGIALGSLASSAVTKSALIIHKPKQLSFSEAATIPTIFMTAYLALVKLAKLKAGETVLIHAGSGGVGLAAIQIAQHLNVQIIATVGSDEKKAYLKSLGIDAVFSSRQTSFEQDIKRITKGKGVDVVLNSLSGRGFIEASLQSCGKNARFIEIGKRDIWTNEAIAQVRSDIEYHILALDQLWTEKPDQIQQLLQEIIALFETQTLKTIKHTVFPLSHTIQAFSYLQQAKQIGKVVIELAPTALTLNCNASYIITGGLGGIGLELCKYLSKCGVKRLLLAARKTPSDIVKALLDSLQTQGTTVEVINCDVGDKVNVQQLIEKSQNNKQYPLKGIFHTAGILDDAPISKQTPEHFEKIYAAKACGAWYLHEITQAQAINLDYFVLFSSFTSLNGAVGQSNYVTANSFLDGLAALRHQQGLPAQSINWGPWQEVGMARDLIISYERQGIHSLNTNDALAALTYVMRQDRAQISVLSANFKMLSEHYVQVPSWLTNLLDRKQNSALIKQLQESPKERHVDILKAAVIYEVRKTLGLTSDKTIDEEKGFFEIGMDSLMALELKNRLQNIINQPLSNTIAFDYPTINEMVVQLIKVLHLKDDKDIGKKAIADQEKTLDEIDIIAAINNMYSKKLDEDHE